MQEATTWDKPNASKGLVKFDTTLCEKLLQVKQEGVII